MTSIYDLIKLKSVNSNTSRATLAKVVEVSENVKSTIEKYRLPVRAVIAGGSIRDLVFGLMPHDYDIFVDVSELSKDEEDDTLLLIADCLGNQLPWELGDENEYVEKENNLKKFVVYETVFDRGLRAAQVIGRRDEGLADDPLKFVDTSFDWDGVKAGYNCHTKEFFFSKKFLKFLKLNRDTPFVMTGDVSPKTIERVRQWHSRFATTYKPFSKFEIKRKESLIEKITPTLPKSFLQF